MHSSRGGLPVNAAQSQPRHGAFISHAHSDIDAHAQHIGSYSQSGGNISNGSSSGWQGDGNDSERSRFTLSRCPSSAPPSSVLSARTAAHEEHGSEQNQRIDGGVELRKKWSQQPPVQWRMGANASVAVVAAAAEAARRGNARRGPAWGGGGAGGWR